MVRKGQKCVHPNSTTTFSWVRVRVRVGIGLPVETSQESVIGVERKEMNWEV